MGSQLVGDQLSMGTEFDGDINFRGIVCPGRQEVGDQKSGDQMCLGLQPRKRLLELK